MRIGLAGYDCASATLENASAKTRNTEWLFIQTDRKWGTSPFLHGFHLRGPNCLGPNLLGQLGLVFGELGTRLDRVVPRMRQLDPQIGLYVPRPRRHDRDAVRHEDRLVDVVRDEEHRLAIGFPDSEQQLLHQRARLVIERAERFV